MSVALMTKTVILQTLHRNLESAVAEITDSQLSRQTKAKLVNALVTSERERLVAQLGTLPIQDRGVVALTVQYCCTVVGLEYRHKVWPYEYMAFSRRIGELWESFCKTAWTHPIEKNIKRISPPKFLDVRESLTNRVRRNVGDHIKGNEIMSDISTLFEIVGDISLKEDEVFTLDDVPHVVDFKSGFGSNEKGNMLRLLTVGRAYKIWNHDTKLMLIVRQDVNNNYLNVLKRSGLWEVHTGMSAYAKIEELTGADIQSVRANVIDWKTDLSDSFFQYLKAQPTDLTTYLDW